MILHLKVIGSLLVLLALLHFTFPKYFKWDIEFKNLSLFNRQMVYVHTFFIAFALFLMGILCLTSSEDLAKTHFGSRVALGLGIFWATRLFIQFFGYSSELWKGKKFETVVHILFSILWMYLTSVFFIVYWRARDL